MQRNPLHGVALRNARRFAIGVSLITLSGQTAGLPGGQLFQEPAHQPAGHPFAIFRGGANVGNGFHLVRRARAPPRPAWRRPASARAAILPARAAAPWWGPRCPRPRQRRFHAARLQASAIARPSPWKSPARPAAPACASPRARRPACRPGGPARSIHPAQGPVFGSRPETSAAASPARHAYSAPRPRFRPPTAKAPDRPPGSRCRCCRQSCPGPESAPRRRMRRPPTATAQTAGPAGNAATTHGFRPRQSTDVRPARKGPAAPATA
jgi:hypothetical protein